MRPTIDRRRNRVCLNDIEPDLAHELHARRDPDGRYWLGVADYPGLSRIQRIEAEIEQHRKSAQEFAAQVAQIPAEYCQRHGALIGGQVTMSSVNGVTSDAIYSPLPELTRVEWTQIARDTDKQYGQTLRRATLADGRSIYEIQSIQYDDYRTTFYLPPDLYQVVLAAEAARRGLTPEKAREWLAEYRGCVDTDIYEYAATVRPARDEIAG